MRCRTRDGSTLSRRSGSRAWRPPKRPPGVRRALRLAPAFVGYCGRPRLPRRRVRRSSAASVCRDSERRSLSPAEAEARRAPVERRFFGVGAGGSSRRRMGKPREKVSSIPWAGVADYLQVSGPPRVSATGTPQAPTHATAASSRTSIAASTMAMSCSVVPPLTPTPAITWSSLVSGTPPPIAEYLPPETARRG
jgi:hypothetical protein